VRQLAFFAAIEIGDEPSAAEGLDVESIAVEDAYDGVRLEGGVMTQEFIDDMTERFKKDQRIHKKYVYQIVMAVRKIVYDEATMVEMTVPEGTELTVCGDTHGASRHPSRFLTLTCARVRWLVLTMLTWSRRTIL
jgi:serine/threonine-protein phosphatase 5